MLPKIICQFLVLLRKFLPIIHSNWNPISAQISKPVAKLFVIFYIQWIAIFIEGHLRFAILFFLLFGLLLCLSGGGGRSAVIRGGGRSAVIRDGGRSAGGGRSFKTISNVSHFEYMNKF